MNSEQEKKAAMSLGAAMLGAMDLLVRHYLGAEKAEIPPFSASVTEQTLLASQEVNESFDMERFERLGGLAAQKSTAGETAAVSAVRESFPVQQTAGEENILRPEDFSAAMEKDSRRYDGQFYLYE